MQAFLELSSTTWGGSLWHLSVRLCVLIQTSAVPSAGYKVRTQSALINRCQLPGTCTLDTGATV